MIQVIEPATEAVLDELPRAGVEEVAAAVERAREAFEPWRAIAGRRRWIRPSGWVTVPSFSAAASAGKTTVAYSRRPSLRNAAWAITVVAWSRA